MPYYIPMVRDVLTYPGKAEGTHPEDTEELTEMMGPSKAATARVTADLKAKYILDGIILTDAIKAAAAKDAARLWTGRHPTYKSEAEMAAGFEAETLRRIAG